MASLKNKDTNTPITPHVSLATGQEVIRAVQPLLDGSTYIQRIGAPTVTYEVTAYVQPEGKAMLMDAEDKVALLEVKVSSGVYLGRITELSFSERMAGNWFEVKMKLAREAAG